MVVKTIVLMISVGCVAALRLTQSGQPEGGFRPVVFKHGNAVLKSSNNLKDSKPTMFCFSVVMPGTAELELLDLSIDYGSLGGCEAFAVYSNVTIEDLAVKVEQAVNGSMNVGATIHHARSGDIKIGNNAPILKQVWQHVFDQGEYKKYDWTVQINLDAIMFPARVAEFFATVDSDRPTYIRNSLLNQRRFTHILGSMESLNRAGMTLFADHIMDCEGVTTDQPEDAWLSQCLKKLKRHAGMHAESATADMIPIKGAPISQLAQHPPITPEQCANVTRAVYHPVKKRAEWEEFAKACLKRRSDEYTWKNFVHAQ